MSRVRIPRWYFVYFILAAFNVVVIGASLFVTDHLLEDYTGSVEQVKLLTYNQNLMIDLDDIIARMNQPGNDVFTSHDPDAEEARLIAYTSEFEDHLSLLRNKLAHDFSPSEYAQIEEALVKAQLSSAQAAEHAQQVFSLYRKGDVSAASSSMALMDAAHGNVDDAVGGAITVIGKLLKDDLDHQLAHASEIRSFETIIMVLAGLVIAGTAYYGYTVAQRLKRDIEERQRTAEELSNHRDNLELLVKQQTLTIRKESEQNIFLRTISEAANEAQNIYDVLEICINEFCTYSDFSLGHCYLYDRSAEILQSSGVWSLGAEVAFAPFLEHSKRATFSANGMPGFILQHRKPLWIEDVQQSDLFVRKRAARETGIVTAIGCPILTNGNALGVLEFFNTQRRDPDTTTLHLLQQMAMQLGRAIERFEYQHALEEARRAADAANSAKSDFLANMSHELRTPLNSIIGMANLLLEDRVTPTQRDMLETVNYSSKNLLDIVNDVIDFSKIESGALELESIPFNVQETVSKVVDMLMPIASSKGLSLSLEIENTPVPNVVGDPTRYARIVTNLASNALKYTEAGDVRVTLGFETMGDHAITLRLSVADTGIGIAQEKLGKIFEKFVQADSSTTRKYGGSGLGLAITKQLVEAMNGTISVTSKEGVGSTFTAIVPFPTTADVIDDHRTQQIQFACGVLPAWQARILVAEDHPLNQAFMKKLLPSIGITRFTIVENGKLALEAVGRNEADLVFMDCHMPEMNGYEATQAIREAETMTGYRIPIIAMTANALMGERERCIACGMDEYISKPVSKPLLMQILSNWIRFEDSQPAPHGASINEAAVMDLTILRTITEGNVELERDFAKTFFKQSQLNFAKLREHCVDGISQPWKEAAHSLKGGAATMGAMKLRAIAADAQEMIDAVATERTRTLAQLEAAFSEACSELAKLGLLDRRGG